MASPFSIFRKRQKLFLAIAGVGAMGAFIFLPIMGRMMRSGSGGARAVVVTKYGTVGEREMDVLIQQRQISNTFFEQLLRHTLSALARNGQLNDQNLNRFAQFKQGELLREGLLLPPSETSVVQGMVAARRAEELGLTVSNERINRLILRVSQDVVTREEISGILRSMNIRISEQQLFDIIRPELLANDLLYFISSGTQTNTTPAQRWDYFLRSRRKTTAELVAVNVDDFLDQVPDPSEKELLAYFNAHKEEYPRADSPEPGFRQPERRAFEYFKAEFEHFYDEDAITDEEVAEYYEANKKNYPYRGLAPDVIDTEAADQGEPDPEESTDEEASSEDAKGDAPETKEMPADESSDESESPSTEDKPEPSEEEPAEEEPSAEEPNDDDGDSPAAEEPESSEPSANEDQASVAHPAGSLRNLLNTALAGALFLQGEEAESEDETDPVPTEADTPANADADDSGTPEADADAVASDTDESGGETSEEEPLSEDKPIVPSLSLRDLSVDYLLPRVISQGANPEYDPLWRVAESIRETLAREKTSDLMTAALTPLRQKMQSYSTNRLEWEVAVEDNRDLSEPPRLDFAAMAVGVDGVTAESTGIVSAQQLVDNWDLGNTNVFNSTGQTIGSTVEQAYGNTPDFSAAMARDSDGNEYLYWIVDKREAKIPTLDEVHDEVLLSWKRKEAEVLARKHAESLADVARDPKFSSLAQAFADKTEIEVVDTGLFSWLTSGDVPMTFGGGQLRLSEIPGVDRMGNDFMRGVFSLAPQSVGVFFDKPRTAAYVVRVGEFTPDEFVLRQQFLAAPYTLYQNAGRIDRQETQRRWFDNLLAEADLKWEREPRDGR